MLFSPRIGTSNLVQLCNRVGTQLEAGVDIRRVWRREAERGFGTHRAKMQIIAESIDGGSTMHEAINLTGTYFPILVRQMVTLGEGTGKLDAIFKELGSQYEHQVKLRRIFLAAITWPMIQLILAILIVGVLIYVMGIVSEMTGRKIDILGLGLVGAEGVRDYFLIVGTSVFGIWTVYNLWSRGNLDFLPIDRIFFSIPGISTPMKTLALSRMAWVMAITVGAGMEIRQAMKLAIRVTKTSYYTRYTKAIDKGLRNGEEIHDILRRTRAFPNEFLDTVETGEMAGMLAESMEKLSEIYQEKARAALNTLAIIAGLLVWMMIAGILIGLIFTVFSFYLGTLNEALDGVNNF